jgi:pSer/pThr/pTyr-binding forkhead associated (FHA) protein
VLPPPEATLIIGRGDEATWVILDEDLSRAHASVHRGWDGVTITDLASKNGTRVDGTKVGATPVELHDGARVALGDVVLRFRDPAELHLRGGAPSAPASPPGVASGPQAAHPASSLPVVLYALIAIVAIAALIWILAS